MSKRRNQGFDTSIEATDSIPEVTIVDETPVEEVVEDTVDKIDVVEETVEPEVVETVTEEVKVEEKPEIKVEVQQEPKPKKVFAPPAELLAKNAVVKPKENTANKKYRIKSTATTTYLGKPLPKFAYKNIYSITKVLPTRVIIKAGVYELAMRQEDLEVIE